MIISKWKRLWDIKVARTWKFERETEVGSGLQTKNWDTPFSEYISTSLTEPDIRRSLFGDVHNTLHSESIKIEYLDGEAFIVFHNFGMKIRYA